MSMTTTVELRAWLEEGKRQGATHMIVVCDTFDYDDYPVYVQPGTDVRVVETEYRNRPMSKIMEVYRLDMNWESQLGAVRAFNY